MSTLVQNIIGLSFLAVVFILTRYGIGLKTKNAGVAVLEDLRRHKAMDMYSAVSLGYATTSWLKFGLRDYRPKALHSLVEAGVVGITGEKKYYLIQDFVQGKGVEELANREGG
jgi:hypothetical protein